MTSTARFGAGRTTNIVLRVESAEAARELSGLLRPEEAIARASESSGSALPQDLRGRFESSLGTDLSGVRVHTGAESAAAARAVGARAFAYGQDVHFGAGEYDPASTSGMHLIAHEIAHTVQQRGVAPTRQDKVEVSRAGDAAEVEADRAADAMVAGSAAAVTIAPITVSRRPHEGEGDDDGDDAPDASFSEDQNWGVTPQPDDPWARPVESWDVVAMPVAPPDGPPPAYPGFSPMFPDAKPWLDNQGHPARWIRPDVLAKRTEACMMFGADVDKVGAMWSTMSPLVAAYVDTSKELANDESVLSLIGMSATQGADDLGTQTENQAVGPDGAQTQVGDLFDKDGQTGNQVQGVDPVKGSKEVQLKYRAVRSKQLGLHTAKEGVVTAKTGLVEKNAQADAIADSIALDEDAAKQKDADEKTKKLEEDKERWKDGIEHVKTVITGICGLIESAEDPIAGVEAAADVYATIGKDIVDISYRPALRAIAQELAGITADIASHADHYKVAASLQAASGLEVALRTIDEKTDLVTQAWSEYSIAYDDFAAEVGKETTAKKGKKQGARVQAALEAVPRVEMLLSRIDAIIPACATPPYTEASGLGWTACDKPGGFPKAIGLLRGYQMKFTQESQKWTARLQSLRAIVATVTGK